MGICCVNTAERIEILLRVGGWQGSPTGRSEQVAKYIFVFTISNYIGFDSGVGPLYGVNIWSSVVFSCLFDSVAAKTVQQFCMKLVTCNKCIDVLSDVKRVVHGKKVIGGSAT